MINIIIKDPKVNGKVDDLVIRPKVITVCEFDEKSAVRFTKEISAAEETGQQVIPIVINSYGGFVDSMLSMISDIENSRLNIATVIQGKAMSCGLILAGYGDVGYRFIDKNSRIMMHEISDHIYGKVSDIQVDAGEAKRLNEFIYEKLSVHCGHINSFFWDFMQSKKHKDIYLSPQESLDLKLADHIAMPEFVTSIEVNQSFKW